MPTGYIVKYATYRAVYRLAARPYALSAVAAGAGRIQLATLHHAATSIYKLQLRACYVALESTSAAAIVMLDLVKLTGATLPATGNPAITPTQDDPREPADTDTVCLALPSTPGTEGAVLSTIEWNLGITGAASTNNPPPPLTYQNMLDPSNTGYIVDPLVQVVAARPLVAEGWAVTADINAAATVKGYVIMEYARQSQVGNQG